MQQKMLLGTDFMVAHGIHINVLQRNISWRRNREKIAHPFINNINSGQALNVIVPHTNSPALNETKTLATPPPQNTHLETNLIDPEKQSTPTNTKIEDHNSQILELHTKFSLLFEKITEIQATAKKDTAAVTNFVNLATSRYENTQKLIDNSYYRANNLVGIMEERINALEGDLQSIKIKLNSASPHPEANICCDTEFSNHSIVNKNTETINEEPIKELEIIGINNTNSIKCGPSRVKHASDKIKITEESFCMGEDLKQSVEVFAHQIVNNIILKDLNGEFVENFTDVEDPSQNKRTPAKNLSFSEQLEINLDQQTILMPTERDRLRRLLRKYGHVFSENPGRTFLEPHHIDTGDHRPIARQPYPESLQKQQLVKEEVQKMLDLNIIEPSYSPWSSPITLVKKPDGSNRFCVDYRSLNKITSNDQFPMPNMASIVQNLQGARYLSSMDMTMGYFQCAVNAVDIPKTAFTCSAGLYQFLVLPFGLKSAPATFNRLMAKVLKDVIGTCAMPYLDDVVIFSETFSQHLIDIEKVLTLLHRENLTVKLKKCQFCRLEFKFLGHILKQGKIFIDLGKIESIKTFIRPRNVKEVQRFLGLTGWLRKHLPQYAHISRPLTALTGGKNPKKDFTWSADCEAAFQELKTQLIQPGTSLTLPNFSLPFVIECDAADHGIAGILSQTDDSGNFCIVEYASRILQPREVNYTISEKELLAVIFAIHKFRPYISDRPFTVVTDHNALKWLLKTKDLSGRLTRWALKLQEYDYTVQYRRGKDNHIPDALSRGTNIEEVFDPDDDEDRMAPPKITIVNLIDIKVNFSTIQYKEILINQEKEEWISNIRNKILMLQQQNGNTHSYKKYHLINNLLYYKPSDKHVNYKLVLPHILINKALAEFHTDPTGGHFGIEKTLDKIQRRLFWHHMKEGVTTFVKTCHICQLTKHPNFLLKGPMQSNYVSHPMELWGVDLMGPYTRSTRQNKYLLVLVDHFSKWIEVFPMKASTTNIIVTHLTDCMSRYGIPERILSDNGPQFISAIYKKLCQVWNVKNIYSSRYHPSSNFVETTNRTIKRLLRSYVDENQKTWDVHIPQFLLAMRTTVNKTTGFTPARLFLGRELLLPWDATHNWGVPPHPENEKDYISNLQKQNEEIQEQVEITMRREKEKQKENYDKNTKLRIFNVGDRVKLKTFYLSDAANDFTSKLAPVWRGPYTISHKVSDLAYRVVDQDGKEAGTWNIVNIDKYLEPQQPTETSGTNPDPLPQPHIHPYNTRSKNTVK